MNLKNLHCWHRTIGIITVFFVGLLATTGLLLNHSDRFGYQNTYVRNELLLNWYDIRPKEPPSSYSVNSKRITRIGNRLYFNKQELEVQSDRLFGAVVQHGVIIVALKDKLLLLTGTGEVIEILAGDEAVPAGMSAIGLDKYNELVIKGIHGDYIADINKPGWKEYEEAHADWSVASKVPADLYAELLLLYRGKGLSLERVLLDLHSGRLFGYLGVYIVDIAALTFLFLALSGGWMFIKYNRN